MDSGEITSLAAIVCGLLTAFGAGDLVPFVGPALQGALAIITLITAVASFVSHRNKTVAMVAAGIKR